MNSRLKLLKVRRILGQKFLEISVLFQDATARLLRDGVAEALAHKDVAGVLDLVDVDVRHGHLKPVELTNYTISPTLGVLDIEKF